jgi:hypothetical protein
VVTWEGRGWRRWNLERTREVVLDCGVSGDRQKIYGRAERRLREGFLLLFRRCDEAGSGIQEDDERV